MAYQLVDKEDVVEKTIWNLGLGVVMVRSEDIGLGLVEWQEERCAYFGPIALLLSLRHATVSLLVPIVQSSIANRILLHHIL